MAKKSGKTSTRAEKRRQAPKVQMAIVAAAEASSPPAAVVEVGQAEGTAVETSGAPTAPVDGAGSEVPGADAVAKTPAGPAPGQAAETGRDQATTEPKGRGKTRAARSDRKNDGGGRCPGALGRRPRCTACLHPVLSAEASTPPTDGPIAEKRLEPIALKGSADRAGRPQVVGPVLRLPIGNPSAVASGAVPIKGDALE